MNTTATTFDPSPAIADQILFDLSSPEVTLADIAVKADTSLTALCVWLSRLDIAERLRAIEAAMFAKARLIAANHLPFVVHAAVELISALGGPFLGRSALRADSEPGTPSLREGSSSAFPDHRSRESARKAMGLFSRLCRIMPQSASSASTPSNPPPPACRGRCRVREAEGVVSSSPPSSPIGGGARASRAVGATPSSDPLPGPTSLSAHAPCLDAHVPSSSPDSSPQTPSG